LESRYWFEPLGLGLGVWQGRYQGAEGRWLRWYDAANHWVPTEAEARRSAVPRLAAMGLMPAQIAEALGLALTEVEQYLSSKG
jgi:DNA-binding NarL/FixJ family response regulator